MILLNGHNVNKHVALGIAVKNSEGTIRDAVSSILEQTYPHELMEIIVVDGGSVDATTAIISDVVSHSDIRYRLYSDEGAGLSAARQMVIDNADSEYLVWVDADVVIPENYVRDLVSLMERNSRLAGARGIMFIANPSGLSSRLENLSLLLVRENQVLDGHGIFRLEVIRQVGGFDACIKRAGEDVDLIIRMIESGWSFCMSGARFYHKPSLWIETWRRWIGYGYATHYLRHKHKGWFVVWNHSFPIVCIFALRDAFLAYKRTHEKISFLMPFYKLLLSIAWWAGFLKSHVDGFGHCQFRHE